MASLECFSEVLKVTEELICIDREDLMHLLESIILEQRGEGFEDSKAESYAEEMRAYCNEFVFQLCVVLQNAESYEALKRGKPDVLIAQGGAHQYLRATANSQDEAFFQGRHIVVSEWFLKCILLFFSAFLNETVGSNVSEILLWGCVAVPGITIMVEFMTSVLSDFFTQSSLKPHEQCVYKCMTERLDVGEAERRDNLDGSYSPEDVHKWYEKHRGVECEFPGVSKRGCVFLDGGKCNLADLPVEDMIVVLQRLCIEGLLIQGATPLSCYQISKSITEESDGLG